MDLLCDVLCNIFNYITQITRLHILRLIEHNIEKHTPQSCPFGKYLFQGEAVRYKKRLTETERDRTCSSGTLKFYTFIGLHVGRRPPRHLKFRGAFLFRSLHYFLINFCSCVNRSGCFNCMSSFNAARYYHRPQPTRSLPMDVLNG